MSKKMSCPMRRQDKCLTDVKHLHEVLEGGKIMRLGFIDTERNLPYVIPCSFGYDKAENVLYFHSAKSGRKIDIIKKKPVVCFEVEVLYKVPDFNEVDMCSSTHHYKTVIGYGVMEIIEEEKERFKGLKLVVEQQSGKKFDENLKFTQKHFDELFVMKLKIDQWSAKQSPPPKNEDKKE